MKKNFAVLVVVVTALVAGLAYWNVGGSDRAPSLIKELFFDKGFEPSGVTLCDGNIYVVSDEGRIAYGKSRFNYFELEERDLEGVTCSKKYLFVAEEGNDNILQLTFFGKLVSDFNVKRTFRGKKVLHKKGDGLEALAYYKEDSDYYYFMAANQSDEFSGEDKSAIMFIQASKSSGKAQIYKYFPMKIKDISGLFFANGVVHFISDTEDKLYMADTGMNIMKTIAIGGESQEGIFIDYKKGKMYIADDEGSLLIFSNKSAQ